jgi:hypothetical protein
MKRDPRRRKISDVLRPALFCVAFVLALPMLPLLVAGRLLFFGAVYLWTLMMRWLRPSPAPEGLTPVLPFWVAWFIALLWVAAAIAGSVGVVTNTDAWEPLPQLIARTAVVLGAIAALFAAYRTALLGTQALQRALAQNLAMLIAFELEQLRLEAERRTQLLHAGSQIDLALVATAELDVPGFFTEREEIRAAFGEPTERVLSDLLQSLQNFNIALTSRPVQKSGLGGDVQAHLMAIYEHLGRAMQYLGPHLRRPA